nr:helix-turn-helix domain-containing protein [Methylobacterium sp. PvR107]
MFHQRGEHISDDIRDCRIGTAAQRLADPARADLPIGLLAYGCGFASQAHFARRFKARPGMTPRAYRHAALLGAP